MSSKKPSVDAELEKLQRETSGYFWHETNPANGLVIDKTGTLTVGQPEVVEIVTADGVTEDVVLSAAAAVEQHRGLWWRPCRSRPKSCCPRFTIAFIRPS